MRRTVSQWLPWLLVACAVWFAATSLRLHQHHHHVVPTTQTPALLRTDGAPAPPGVPPDLAGRWEQWEELQVTVRDAHTGGVLGDAQVVVAETGQRFVTGPDGQTPVARVPVIPETRFASPALQQLRGRLTLVTYRAGYRDGVELGVPLHPGQVTAATVFLHPVTPDDRRIEPHAHHAPVHHIWLLQLADELRSPPPAAQH
jgi:hypothetical protein